MIIENKCLKGVKNMTYAYARVSAQDQNLTRQIEVLSKYGVENIYSAIKKAEKTLKDRTIKY